MPIELTVACATYDDPHTIDTAMDWMIHHADVMPRCEVLVVDNAPHSRNGRDLRGRMEKRLRKSAAADVRYIEMPDPIGTCPPRQRIFEEATGDAVLVMDAHVRVFPGAIAKLLDFYQSNPECMDLLTGPIVLDDLTTRCTHFDDIWGGPMRGRWGEAWQQPDGTNCGVIDGEGKCAYVELALGAKPQEGPAVAYGDRRKALPKHGWRQLGYSDADDFDIPAQGLGLFSCRKAAWPGFHPDFRGFGGGEFFIHELIRRAGRRVRCLGLIPWWHLTGHVEGTKYPNVISDRVRNAMIGNNALGWSNDRLRKSMLSGKKPFLSPETFDKIEADPIAFPYSKPRGLPVLDGPGKELLAMIAKLGIHSSPGCGCKAFARTMNGWGVEGCRGRKQEIVTVLRKNSAAWGWNIAASAAQQEADEAALSDETRAAIEPIQSEVETEAVEPASMLDKAKVALLAVATGMVFKIDATDPFPGMVDEAIRRAEAKAARAT